MRSINVLFLLFRVENISSKHMAQPFSYVQNLLANRHRLFSGSPSKKIGIQKKIAPKFWLCLFFPWGMPIFSRVALNPTQKGRPVMPIRVYAYYWISSVCTVGLSLSRQANSKFWTVVSLIVVIGKVRLCRQRPYVRIQTCDIRTYRSPSHS